MDKKTHSDLGITAKQNCVLIAINHLAKTENISINNTSTSMHFHFHFQVN